ncbi:MAG TPA: SDR family oxidoreductase [Haliscomenobacter sp.]|uniref:SDR family oxidoreductase n=1 Tax=Haliscomenobacter sp. TaxID=2717303 RepID=UPI002B914BA8|nr:SDR family oxidoreductase [Haliscomenobacter sp.]HOY16877.1 SDR family oxidoreductase [Haliscomenobacter sp.]
MNNKICVVTGANSGLGFETAKALAAQGARVILLSRSADKGQEALDKIFAATQNDQLELMTVDLASQASIRETGQKILDKYPVIDTLVNNAGTWISKHSLTEDGVETMFAVNHLAYVLMTHVLYPALRQAPDGRIVCVASDSHFQFKINYEDLNLNEKYHGLRAYAQSKGANVMFVSELHKRKLEENISAYAIQPGLVKTDIGVKRTNWLHALAWKIRRSGGVSPAEGAQCQIFCASAAEAKGQSGLYWDKCKPKPSAKYTYVEDERARLWEMCMEMCGIEDFFG